MIIVAAFVLCFKTGRQQPTESYMLVIIESVNCTMHMYELNNSHDTSALLLSSKLLSYVIAFW